MARLSLSGEEINLYFPICGASVYGKAVLLHRQSILPVRPYARKRGAVVQLSRRSVNNFVLRVGSSSHLLRSMSTLTYGAGFPLTGKQVKADMKAWLISMARKFGLAEYAWFFEFQKRGAPHVHVLLDIVCPGSAARSEAARIWARVSTPDNFWYSSLKREKGRLENAGERYLREAVEAQHRRADGWANIRRTDGAFRYVVKYACKPYQKYPPDWFGHVGRYVGWSSGFALPDVTPMGLTEDQARQLLGLLGRDMGGFEVLPRVIFHSGNLPTDG